MNHVNFKEQPHIGKTAAIDDKLVGDAELNNWGAYIRAERPAGPAGVGSSPMFRQMIEAMEGGKGREAYRYDDAENTALAIHHMLDEKMTIAVYIYFAEPYSVGHLTKSATRFHKFTGERMTVRGFKRYIDDICVRVGLATRLKDAGINYTIHNDGK